MDRVHLSPSGEEELLRLALDQEPASAEVTQHLKQCQECQQKLADFRSDANFLESHLFRFECPSGIQLSLYCADLLPVEERTQVAGHLLDCPLCADEAAFTRQFYAELDTPLSPSPPLSIRRLFAQLVRSQPVLALRGVGTPPEWPCQYRAEPLHLSLHLSRMRNGANSLIGIVQSIDSELFVDDFGGGKVLLYDVSSCPIVEGEHHVPAPEAEPLQRVDVDELGNFVLNNVPAGTYTLIVRVAEFELIVEDLVLVYG